MLATLHILNSHMQLLAAMLDGTDIQNLSNIAKSSMEQCYSKVSNLPFRIPSAFERSTENILNSQIRKLSTKALFSRLC